MLRDFTIHVFDLHLIYFFHFQFSRQCTYFIIKKNTNGQKNPNIFVNKTIIMYFNVENS